MMGILTSDFGMERLYREGRAMGDSKGVPRAGNAHIAF
jgi:hypothetical protein